VTTKNLPQKPRRGQKPASKPRRKAETQRAIPVRIEPMTPRTLPSHPRWGASPGVACLPPGATAVDREEAIAEAIHLARLERIDAFRVELTRGNVSTIDQAMTKASRLIVDSGRCMSDERRAGVLFEALQACRQVQAIALGAKRVTT
jgi:hypothetical protein